MEKIIHTRIARLYLKSFSAPVIARKLKIPLSQVYRSLKTQNIERRSAKEQNKIRFENSPLSFAYKNKLNEKEKGLLVAAIMLYYGEGAKTQNTVDFANSELRAHLLFLKFLRKVCRIDERRLRLYMYCFNGQDPVKLVKFWSSKLNVSINQFTKPYVRPDRKGLKRLMPYGVLHIRYSDKRLLQKILSLIDEVIAEII